MARHQIRISLGADDFARLERAAVEEHALPTTLAASFIIAALDRRDPTFASPTAALLEWLGPQVDAVRESGAWPKDITVQFFTLIEREAPALYAAAVAERGTAALNSNVGRFIRARLGAEVLRRGGRPHLARVAAGRTSLIQNVTLFKSRTGEPNA